jgi:hypothetical protein|tara:strand:+ start:70 stop:1710 length:1641 start_codon:yes stop_codon:yes gene_type:complete
MAIELYDAANSDGLFDILGKLFQIIKQGTSYQSSTLKTALDNYIQTLNNKSDLTDEFHAAAKFASASGRSERLRILGSASGASRSIRMLLHEFVEADADQPERSTENSIDYLIDQMETATTHKVDPNVVGISLATGGSNVGDLGICYSSKDQKGYDLQHQFAEAINMKVTGAAGTSATILTETTERVHPLAGEWPKGSGVVTNLGTSGAGGVPNGSFTNSTYTDTPDDWILDTATVGTTLKLTDPEIQTVVISGTPTGGFYILKWTDQDGKLRASDQLAYNASGGTVAGAITSFPGLGSATVVTTGTTPNFTHTITFTGAPGNINQLTSASYMTGGSPAIAHATTTQGVDGSFLGSSLELDSNGAELTTLYSQLGSLAADTCYFLSFRVRRTGAASGGAIKVDLVDGVGGSVLTDTAGTSLTKTVTASGISTGSWDFEFMRFSTKTTEIGAVYVKLYVSSAITSTASIFIDQLSIISGRQLYVGGPYVAVMQGKTNPAEDDNWTLTTTNNRAGELQTYFDRMFDMAGMNKYLPTTGTTLIPDSVIG